MQRRTFLLQAITLAFGSNAAVLLNGKFAAPVFAQNVKTILNDEQARVLAVLARCLFPHADVEDKYYINVARHLEKQVASDEKLKELITSGISTLQAATGNNWLDAGVKEKVTAIEGMAQSPFINIMINTTIDVLYRDQEVLDKFGYQGSSIEYGGYLQRGFDDIDWLPAGKNDS